MITCAYLAISCVTYQQYSNDNFTTWTEAKKTARIPSFVPRRRVRWSVIRGFRQNIRGRIRTTRQQDSDTNQDSLNLKGRCRCTQVIEPSGEVWKSGWSCSIITTYSPWCLNRVSISEDIFIWPFFLGFPSLVLQLPIRSRTCFSKFLRKQRCASVSQRLADPMWFCFQIALATCSTTTTFSTRWGSSAAGRSGSLPSSGSPPPWAPCR